MKTTKNIFIGCMVLCIGLFSCAKVEMPGSKQTISINNNHTWKSEGTDSSSLKIKINHSVTVKKCLDCGKRN